MPATAFNAQSAVARHARARHYTPCMWGGGATLELATHARRAARIVVGLSNMKVRCTSDEALFFVLRPWCDVAAVASNAKPAAAYEASAQAAPLAVSREKAQHSNLLRERTTHASFRWLGPCRRPLHRRDTSLLVARLWCDVPTASSKAKPVAACDASARAGARYLWGGDAALEFSLHVRCRVVLWLADDIYESCRVACAGAPLAMAVPGAGAHHSSLLRTRAVLRWL